MQRLVAFPSKNVPPRDIDVWLPPGYDDDPDRRFPVRAFSREAGRRTGGAELLLRQAERKFGPLGQHDRLRIETETELLRVFLASRGNLREVEKHLGVSYPTARAR